VISVGVELGARRYDVLIGDEVRHELAGVIAGRLGDARRAVVVTQPALEEAGVVGELELGIPFDVVNIGDGETTKSLTTVENLCRAFARAELSRADVVVAVGGGLVSDVAGYAAASFHRGISYVTLATTLLAQIDAAIGGKTGVNLPEGKNLVGAFWQPAGVLCDTSVLASLPAREWASGRGEMAKYAFLGSARPDASLLELPLDEQVARCVAIKAEVVAADEREGDRRMILNYGHTLGHALEAAAFAETSERDSLRHGEAVAIGLVFAGLLARRLGRIDDDAVALHRAVVAGFDLPVALPEGADPDTLVSFMQRDKKAHHDLTMVLDGPTGVEVVRGIERGDVLATLAEMETRP
jgi:5-deoxy-5-amino-3-dehydroquinate synthase